MRHAVRVNDYKGTNDPLIRLFDCTATRVGLHFLDRFWKSPASNDLQIIAKIAILVLVPI